MPAAEEPPVPADTRMAEVTVDLSDQEEEGGGGPVFITKKVQVPVTLGPEDLVRGANLRLVLEIRVDGSGSREDGESRVA